MTTIKQLMSLHGRCALLTGATGKLGRVIANTLAELGAELILVDRPGSGFEQLESELQEKWQVKSWSLSCDLELEEERLAMIDTIKNRHKNIDILINNAAFVGTSGLEGWSTSFEKQRLDTWRRAIEVNLTSAFHLCQAFLSELKKSKNANIVNIASIYGEYGPDWRLYEDTDMANPAAYAVSKGGVIQLTRWLATTLAPHIRVNAISPGGIFREQPEVFVQRYTDKTPLGRMAKEEDFCGAITFLTSDLSSYVTGQNLRINGGWGEW